ncbi:MAG: glycosyl hydrolase family 65 protein [Fimbriimonas sp.]|nr:glycosyl hydrolase family 65 protein [Fimbriimonas sp.]
MRNVAPRPKNRSIGGITFNLFVAVIVGALIASGSVRADTPPDDFPHFKVPGHDPEMQALRDLFWHHYLEDGPGATLWDEWIPSPTLWPAIATEARMVEIRERWKQALSSRILDSEGYVGTHQHPSIAHPLGWPFPFWSQGDGGYGWHFSFKDTVGPPWRPETLSNTEGWELSGASSLNIGPDGWNIHLDDSNAQVTAPVKVIDTFQSPFIQLRWRSTGLTNAHPYIEWATESESGFSKSRRMYFDPVPADATTHTVIPMYLHKEWKGKATRLRLGFDNSAGGSVTIQALFTQFDTRQNVNNASFIDGCAAYFHWTGDIEFLRFNIERIRIALQYLMVQQGGLQFKAIHTTWVGHNGKSGIRFEDGKKVLVAGQGIGDNYWDLLPFGNFDAYATVRYYAALKTVAELEDEIRDHREWGIEAPPKALSEGRLEAHASEVKREGNRLFWSPKDGRFVACIDTDNKTHDYGYTFLNLEAIAYDFADEKHADQILKWIRGQRIVGSDTATGTDIYRWRFAPRATTRRNVDWYIWSWSAPESIAWGDQVQDGGAVLGWSYHDVMSRLQVIGPDDAWNRLREIAFWYAEIEAAGGYRQYYNGSHEGHLQGGGVPGGLGVDREFAESILVPQVLIDGFMGFVPKGDGIEVNPRLPKEWPEFTIDRIHWHDLILTIRATHKDVEITRTGGNEPVEVTINGHRPIVWSGDRPLKAKS